MSGGYTEADRERWWPEKHKRAGRTAFERDRARILHSSALRRLGAKTQVLGPGTDDFVRTRLTHTLEVAQVGRELGKSLGCDPDVVDAACLAHDLGHPPFGHNGERALAEIAAGIGGFEGNAQTLRLLTRLEPKVITPEGRSVGLNLTRASLDASVKYPWSTADAPAGRRPKFGLYAEDADIFDWLRAGAADGVRCIEADVMDIADDIAYSVHDVEDGIVGGHLGVEQLADEEQRARVLAITLDWYGGFTEDELRAAMDRLTALPYTVTGFDGTRGGLAALKDMTSQLIGRFCSAADRATRAEYGDGRLTRYRARLVVPAETRAEITVLKGLAATYVMAPRETEPLYYLQREIIYDLVEVLSERAPVALEPGFAADWVVAADDAARLRVIIDQVASLTDVSAAAWHVRLIRPKN